MQTPLLNPDVNDLAPSDPALMAYDAERANTYIRMLDANEDGADWREVSRIVLHIDPEQEPDRARRAFDSHLALAKWAALIPATPSRQRRHGSSDGRGTHLLPRRRGSQGRVFATGNEAVHRAHSGNPALRRPSINSFDV